MAKVSAEIAKFRNLMSGSEHSSDNHLVEVTMTNGKKLSFNPSAVLAIEEKDNNRSKIWILGAGSRDLAIDYDAVFHSPAKALM